MTTKFCLTYRGYSSLSKTLLLDGNLQFKILFSSLSPDGSEVYDPNQSDASNNDYYNSMYRPFAANKEPSTSAGNFQKPTFRFGHYKMYPDVPKSAPGQSKKNLLVDPDVIMLGRDALDNQLSCLYQTRSTGQFRCLVCRWEFPRKYPLHRHIMLKHLKMMLVGCPYCNFEGIEKYNVSTHIREVHKDKPVSIKFTQPNVQKRVQEFVNDMTKVGGLSQQLSLIKKPGSVSRPNALLVKNEVDEDNPSENDTPPPRAAPPPLVVAMQFKNRKKNPASSPSASTSDEFVVKTEVEHDEYEEGDALTDDGNSLQVHFSGENGDSDEITENAEQSGNERKNSVNSQDGQDYENGDEEYLTGFSSLRRPLLENYAPGSYRAPAGGKAKALDLITKIKVIKGKSEGGITKFYCGACKFISLHRTNVVRHIYKLHEGYKNHTCPICNYQTLSLMLMKKHTATKHPGTEYNENEAFNLNLSQTKPVQPSSPKPMMGPLSFQKKRQLEIQRKMEAAVKANQNKSSSGGSKQFACAYCLYETDTQDDIAEHTKAFHSQGEEEGADGESKPSDDKALACWGDSKKAVKRKSSYGINLPDGLKRKKRFIFEKGDELFQCGYCDTRETSMGRMQDHINFEHPGEFFKCKQIPAWRFICKSCCVKTMATSKMKYHLNRHINYRPYTCPDCGVLFPSPDQCRRHARNIGMFP